MLLIDHKAVAPRANLGRFLIFTFLTCVVLLSPAISSADGPDVAIVAGGFGFSFDNRSNNVKSILLESGLIGSVDIINTGFINNEGETEVIDFARLRHYDALLFWHDVGGTINSDDIGDALAAYIDDGGGVVIASFAFLVNQTNNFSFGRFNSENYWAMNPSPQMGGGDATSITVSQPAHPVMLGVENFTTVPQFRSTGGNGMHIDAQLLAQYADSVPLVVVREIDIDNGTAKRVDLNFFPPPTDRDNFLLSWDPSTDGGRLMANALVYVAKQSGAPQYTCVGDSIGVFSSPMNQPVTIKKPSRVLPLRMQLLDEQGFAVTPLEIGDSPPLLDIDVFPGSSSVEPPTTLDLAGKSDDGNHFRFSDGEWKLRLKTKNFSGNGNYSATVISGDPTLYEIDQTCIGTFVIGQ